MGETPDDIREVEDIREIIRTIEARMQDVIREARAARTPEDEIAEGIAEIEGILEKLRHLRIPPAEPTPEQMEMLAFALRLAARQGTVMPDFHALYQKKAALDRKWLGSDRGASPPAS